MKTGAGDTEMSHHADLHQQNRRVWNTVATQRSVRLAEYVRFFRDGGSTLYPEELSLLGDVQGETLVHLQCHDGRDSLSLVRLGATVTGVDISDTAIDLAVHLSHATGIPATFQCADVYDWLAEAGRIGQQFDSVFSTYGFIFWLSDIERWAHGVSAMLKPGGRFVMVELHPFAQTFEHDWTHTHPYFTRGLVHSWENGLGTAVSEPDSLTVTTPGAATPGGEHRTHEFWWSLSDVITALLDAGLRLTAFHEYPYTNDPWHFDTLRDAGDGRRYPPDGVPSIPLMYGLRAVK
jgi:2-polyprenyl-3-methyl-5-hydroxy-6-metoxy-1,4-benzoquinol methylase